MFGGAFRQGTAPAAAEATGAPVALDGGYSVRVSASSADTAVVACLDLAALRR